MSIPIAQQERSLAVLTRHLELYGVPQMQIDPAAVRDRAWVRYARCGQWRPDAPDPEIFYAIHADDPATYAAQEYCEQCPVRRYCSDAATAPKWPGVWGGVYRNDRGEVAAMCSHRRCPRYRAPGKVICRWHYDVQVNLRAEAARARSNARSVTESVAA